MSVRLVVLAAVSLPCFHQVDQRVLVDLGKHLKWRDIGISGQGGHDSVRHVSNSCLKGQEVLRNSPREHFVQQKPHDILGYFFAALVARANSGTLSGSSFSITAITFCGSTTAYG